MKNFRFNQMCRMSGMLMGAASVGNDTAKRRQREGLENQGHSSVGLTKLLFTITLLLTLGVGQMWADTNISYSGGYIYFADTHGVHQGSTQLCGRKSNCSNGDWYTAVTNLTNISNTKLYYTSSLEGSGWSSVCWAGWALISNSSGKSNSSTEYWSGSNSTWYSSFNSYGFNSGSVYLITVASSSKGASTTTSYKSSGITALNSTQTAKYATRTGGGTYSAMSSGTTPAKITMSSYKFVSGTYNSVSSVSPTAMSAGGSTYSTDFTAAYTATTTVTVSNVADGWEFDGWYDAATGGSLLQSNKSYTYYPTGAKTVYARFTKVTYSLAGESWTNSSAITWTAASTQKLATSDGVTYSVTMSDEAASAKQFKVLKNETFDGAIAYDTDGVTKICYNGTLADAGAGQNHNFTLTPYLAGDVTVSYNTSTKTLTITCEAPLITFNKASGSGGSDNQKTYSGMNTSNISTPSRSGYAFQGYWSDDATPIQVINSSGAWIANKTGYTQNTSPVKWATGLNANHTFTAHWNANNYTITLDNQSATTAGTTKVTATFDASTNLTSAITKPTKTGYIFGGYFTGTGGTGTQIIGADGNFIASAGGGSTYTDANKKWKYAGNITLKAYWIAITVSATISPSTGATGATKDFTFSITSNVGTDDGYDVAVYSFGTVNSGEPNTASYLNSTVSYNASPKSYTASSIGGFSTAGNYTTKAVVLKGGTVQATSVAITYSAGDYYTVSFNMQGHGSDIASQNILSGSTATTPSPAPTATGYTFGGWYQEAGCTNAYNFSTPVTADKPLYAKWTANNYTVTFDKQSGSGGDNSVSATYDADMPSATMPTRTGYTFGGYYTETEGGGTKYYNADGTSARTWNIDDDTDLYAQWTERTVTVSPTNSYDHGNPSYSNPTATNSGTIGIASTSTLTAQAAGTGYTFAGWTLSDNIYVVSGTPATDREITIRHKTGDGTAVTATAKYNEVLTSDWHIVGTPTSVFHGSSAWDTDDDNMLRKASGSSTADAGSVTINVTALGASASSYQFKVHNSSTTVMYGWSNSNYYNMNAGATKTTGVYSADSHPLYFIPDALGNYVFAVDWSGANPSLTVTWPTSYAIQYSKGTVNGTSGSISAKYNNVSFNSNTKIQSGETITLIAPDEKEGYTWAGWFNNNAGTGVALSMNKTYTPTVSAATTYYACYTLNNHNITYTAPSNGTYTIKVGDAAAVSTNTTSDYGKTITLSAERNWGYDFTGWTVTKDGGGSVTPSSSASANPATFSMPDDDVTISATFTIKSCTITLNNQGADAGKGGTGSQTTNYNTSTGLSTITCPQKTGYIFGGYYTAANGKGSQIIARNGSWNANVTTYMYDGKWVYDGGTTLYAWWIECAGYSFHYGTTSEDDWSKTCFTQDGVTSTWKIENYAIPNKPNFFVGYQEEFYGSGLGTGDTKSKSEVSAWTDTPSKVDGTGQGEMKLLPGGYTVGQATGALGTITIDTNSKDYNLSVGFTPNGYGVTHNSGTHEFVTASSNWRETEVVTLTSGDVSGNFQVKLKTSDSWAATAHGVAENASAVNGRKITGDANIASGLKGVFQMWTDASANNFGLCFVTVHDVTFDMQGHGDAISDYTDVRYNSKISAPSDPSQTGYTFGGWYKEPACTNAWNFASDVVTSDTTLYAKWTAKTYTVTLDQQTGATGYGSSGDGSLTATYDAAFPSAAMPTAANGYAFMGYWSEAGGEGTQFTDASGNLLANIASYTNASSQWIHDGDVTLYAYYKKAEITAITLSDAVVAPSTSITATPTITPTPTGDHLVCWEVQYSNGTPLPYQPTFNDEGGNAVSFNVPAASATYRLQATLKTGSACGNGTLLSTYVTTFQVAGEHEVTVQYQDADGRTIKASVEVTGKPLEWSDPITASPITGYTFHHWLAGDGVTLSEDGTNAKTGVRADSSVVSPVYIKANYDGTLTAVYNKKNMIFFNNTLGWEDVYVYFYSSGNYWNNDNGSGAKYNQPFGNNDEKPHWRHFWGKMTPTGDGNIYYFDYQEEAKTIDPTYWSEINGYTHVAFTKDPQGFGYGADGDDADAIGDGYQYFYQTQAVLRGDFNHSLPMYVPINAKTETKNQTDYYNEGYRMNYPENTGYWLKIYNAWNATKETGAVRTIAIPFSEDKTLPLKLDVEFNDANNHEYWFMVYRNDGTYLGNLSTFNQNSNSEQSITGGNNKSKLVTSAPGLYTFTLTYHDENYYIDVDFPIATGDYRIVYTDNATWSKGAHGASWNHPSDVIVKIDNEATEAKEDIVSFYISKGAGITNTMRFQYASSINASTGAVTWTDVPSGTIDLSDYSSVITKAGVYNFHITQPVGGGSISVEKVEPYTGNYYIRTDCAGNTKWDSFKNVDHQMTYSDYAEANSGYSHYYTHWVTSGTNVKFVIANDYSQCISDTLVEDYGNVYASITAEGNNGAGTLNSASANIRFMWNQATNKISRAYIGGSSNIYDRFLVLEGDAKMFDAAGNALTGVNQDHRIQGEVDTYLGTDNQVILYDDQNFVYEREIKVQTKARAKLTAKYNNSVQYFIGGADETVELLGGTESETKNKMRIVYDFKTNRLVTAYVPSDTIQNALAINADLMIVREHQEAGQQLVFKGSGALSEVHTVYGVMRFNRWTLNNKEKTGGHSVVGDPKSAYERGLYWISFPFDVNLSDVFGFGTYGTDWIIMEYDGAARAKQGYWADSEGFWKHVTNRTNKVLKSGKGYVLALDLDRMKSDNTSFWNNNIEQVELFFPSAAAVNNIQATNITTSVDSHVCTIDRTYNNGADINKNRTRADSHWNIIGIPSYANYGSSLKDGEGGSVIPWNETSYTDDLPFLYEWTPVDNGYTVQSGTTYPFKAMHAYMVQYHGDLYWSLASATPPAIARRRNMDAPKDAEYRLELSQDDKMVDQTFVKLSNDENVSQNFAFDEDLCKEYNANKANIYTFIEGYIPAAGNTLPMSEQTTVVPVGVKIATDGDYTFAIPEGTNGVGVTLIDNETGIRTSLSALDYTVNLNAGTYNERFVLEISPVAQTPTDITVSGERLEVSGARKVLIDNHVYIIRGDKMYDATGALVNGK